MAEHHCNLRASVVEFPDLEVVVLENIPEQLNNTDCGMYVVKFVEHAITGTNLTFSDQISGYSLPKS
jgi:Ulp1 family protease